MSGEGVLPTPSPTAAPEALPSLTWAEAEAIGAELHDRIENTLGRDFVPMARDDMGWGDLVQFVLRRAHERERDRADQQEADGHE